MASDGSLDQFAGQLASAFNAADAVKFGSLYSETATLMPPNQEAVKGRIAIQAWFQPAWERLGQVQIFPVKSSVLGEEAFQIGNFTVTPKDGSTPRAFKYVLILNRVGAQWQIAYDIWNSDQPASG